MPEEFTDMSAEFTGCGVRFRYPDRWELSEEPSDEGTTITVSSSGASFWTLSLFFDCPAPKDVVEQALDTFRAEYDELDVYSVSLELCQRPTSARDIEFVCLEMLNSAFLRSFQTEQFTALVLYQGTDQELEQTREALDAIANSLQYDPDQFSA